MTDMKLSCCKILKLLAVALPFVSLAGCSPPTLDEFHADKELQSRWIMKCESMDKEARGNNEGCLILQKSRVQQSIDSASDLLTSKKNQP